METSGRTPFTSDSTAAEVLAGQDLRGKVALVTGGYSGLGLAATRALVAAGARVVVPARRPSAAREALAGLERVEIEALELGEQASVAAFAARFLASGRAAHLVVLAAGVMALPETRLGPGWEAHLAINHLGHFALVNRLWPAIAAGRARVVAVSSGLAPGAAMRWDDVHFTHGYERWAAYGQSKLANALFAAELDRRGRAAGVHAFSVNPGYVLTPLQRHLTRAEMIAAGWIDEGGRPLLPWFRSPEQGAATLVWAATAPRLEQEGGAYCQHCAVVRRLEGPEDRAQAARLWACSVAWTGVDLPESARYAAFTKLAMPAW